MMVKMIIGLSVSLLCVFVTVKLMWPPVWKLLSVDFCAM
jgi:hypothetical protein